MDYKTFPGLYQFPGSKTLQKLNSNNIDIYYPGKEGFQRACRNAELDIVKCLISTNEKKNRRINIHADDEAAFKFACDSGCIHKVKYLIWLGENGYGLVNIHKSNEDAFVWTCVYGHIGIAKYLIHLGENGYGRINIHANNDFAMQQSCIDGRIEVVKYLVYLGEQKGYGKINHLVDDFIISHSLYHTLQIVKYLIFLNKNGYGIFQISTWTKLNSIVCRLLVQNCLTEAKYFIQLAKNDNVEIDIHHDDDYAMKNTTSFAVRKFLVNYDPKYKWKKNSGYKSYKKKTRILIENLIALHAMFIQTNSDILELNVIDLVKDYVV